MDELLLLELKTHFENGDVWELTWTEEGVEKNYLYLVTDDKTNLGNLEAKLESLIGKATLTEVRILSGLQTRSYHHLRDEFTTLTNVKDSALALSKYAGYVTIGLVGAGGCSYFLNLLN